MRTYLFFLVLLYRATVLAGSGPCDNATQISCGQAPLVRTTAGGSSQFNKDQYTDCTGQTEDTYEGNDLVFQFSIQERQVIHIYLKIPSQKDLDMFLFADCSKLTQCLASSYEPNFYDHIFSESIEYIAEPGTYYLIIDGKESDQNGMFSVQVVCECSCVEDLSPLFATSIRCENFDVYENKPIDPQSNRWKKKFVSGTPAQVKDGYVETLGSEKVLRVKAGPFAGDIYYDLSDLKKEKYRISWQMFFEVGATGVYQLINGEPADGTYADGVYDVYFKAQNRGAVVMNNDTVATFSYNGGNWNDVMQMVDPKNDSIEIWINHQFVFGTKYSAGAELPHLLKAFRFYTITNSNYLIDHICVWEKAVPIIIKCKGDSVCTASGGVFYNSCGAEEELYSSSEYQVCVGPDIQNGLTVCDYGGSAIYRSDIFTSEFGPNDEFPGTLLSNFCVLEAFGDSVPPNYRVQIKQYYNDVGENISPQFSPEEDGHLLVFRCFFNPDSNKVTQVFLGEVNGQGKLCSQFDTGEPMPVGVYYLVAIGAIGTGYTLQVFPQGACDGVFNEITCDTSIHESLQLGNNFEKTGLGDYESCYNGTNTYSGSDIVYRFDIASPTIVNIHLSAPGQKALFLYNYLCAKNCLDYAETPPAGGNADILNVSLLAGRYYIIVDSDVLTEDTFYLSMACVPDLDFIPRMFSSGDTVCPIENGAANIHKLNIPFDASTYLKIGAYVTIGYTDAQDRKNIISDYWNGAKSMEFQLPQDSTGDGLKCGFELNDTIAVTIFSPYNGTDFLFIPCRASYLDLISGVITAKGNFMPTKRSVIDTFIKKDQVSVTINPTFRDFSSQTQTADFIVFSDEGYSITEDPAVDWLDFNFQLGNEKVTVTLDANPLQEKRETDLLITIETNPPLYRTIHISQNGPCIKPVVNLVSLSGENTFCEGELVNLSAIVTNGTNEFYNFNWNNGATSDQLSFEASQNTSFAVTVTEKECHETSSASLNINVINAPEVDAGPDVTICPGESVLLNAVATPSAQFLWSTGQTTAQITVNPNKDSTYIVTVTVAGETCNRTDTVTVFLHPAWSIQPDSLIKCRGAANGQLSVTSTGFPQPQSVLWSNNSTSTVVSGLAAGIYSVQVIDIFGCAYLDTFELKEPPENIMFSNPIVVVPINGNDGEIHVTVTGGFPPYSFTWFNSSNVQVSTSEALTGQPSGCYTLVVEDSVGCRAQIGCIDLPTSTVRVGENLLQIFPNPTDGKLYIQCSKPTTNRVDWSIHDVLGRRIQQGWWNESQQINEVINLEGNSPGYYLLTFEIGKYRGMEIIILF